MLVVTRVQLKNFTQVGFYMKRNYAQCACFSRDCVCHARVMLQYTRAVLCYEPVLCSVIVSVLFEVSLSNIA